MRTTVTLDDDVYKMAMREARARHTSLGDVISHFVRRGASAELKLQRKGGLVLPELPDDSPAVGMDAVRRLESEQ